MTHRLRILRRAREDAQHIFDYINARSPQGGAAWWEAFERAALRATENVVQYGVASENSLVEYKLQQILFRTKHGSAYRIVFTVVGDEVRILRVRGPGQPKLIADELTQSD